MKRIYNKKISIRMMIPLLVFTLLFSSCDKNDPFDNSDGQATEDINGQAPETPKGKKVGDLLINENALLLNGASMDKVKSISDNLVVFETEPLQSDSIFPGILLVGARFNGESIENLMGTIEKVDVIAGEWHVSIQPVALEDFIYSGSISGSFYLPEEGMGLRSGVSGNSYIWQSVEGFPTYDYMTEDVAKTKGIITLPRLQHSSTYSLPIPNLPLTDFGASMSLTAGFTPVFDYTISFGLTGVRAFIIKMQAKDILLNASLNTHAGGKFDLSVSDLYSIPIIPIILGPTGLIISPTISAGPYIHLDAGGEFKGNLFNAQGDVTYELTDLRKMPDWTLKADAFDLGNFKFGAKTTASAGIQMNAGFSLTFVATNLASVGAYSRIGGGAYLIPQSNTVFDFKIYGDIEANARILLGVPPFSYQKVLPLTSWNPVIYSKQLDFSR